jgi:acyl dehydratase
MTDRLPDFSIDITPDSVRRWMFGRDGVLPTFPPVEGDEVPLSYLFFLRSQPAAGISIHKELGRDPDRGLFGGVHYERHSGIKVGDRLYATAAVTERKTVASPRGDMLLTTLVNRWRALDADAVTETVRMIDLPPGPAAAPAAGPATDTELSALGAPVSFSRTQIAWLTVETGDMNPLHLDRDYATDRQFPDVVVPATLIVPVAEQKIATAAGHVLQSLDVRFRAPTFPGEEIVVSATPDEATGAWRFEVSGNGTVRAVGTATFAADAP